MIWLWRDRAYWECEHDECPQALIAPVCAEFIRRNGHARPAWRRNINNHPAPVAIEAPPLPDVVPYIFKVKLSRRLPWDGRTKKNAGKRKAKAARRATYIEARPKYSAWMHAFPGCHPDNEPQGGGA